MVLVLGLGGCDPREGPAERAAEALDPKGPAERAGEQIDHAMERAGEAIEDGSREGDRVRRARTWMMYGPGPQKRP